MGGFQSIWFVRMPSAGGAGQNAGGALLGLIANGRTGLAHAFGQRAHGRGGTAALRRGRTVDILRDGHSAAMLEVPVDFGVGACGSRAGRVPAHEFELPDEFRLYCDLIARYAAPEVSPELAAIFAGDGRGCRAADAEA